MTGCKMNVSLIQHTHSPEQLVALGARLCYSGATIDALAERISEKDQDAFIEGLMQSGHLSVLEHASFTFAVEGVSRILLAQLTRHRMASFSVQSQRYVSKKSGFSYVLPPAIEALGQDAVAEYEAQMQTMHTWYESWQARLGTGEGANEDARFVLPGACETRLITTMNARELLHFFTLRTCRRAQWEIRDMAERMLALCSAAAPALFRTAGPSCVRGACGEGTRSCGQAAVVRKRIASLKQNPSHDA